MKAITTCTILKENMIRRYTGVRWFNLEAGYAGCTGREKGVGGTFARIEDVSWQPWRKYTSVNGISQYSWAREYGDIMAAGGTTGRCPQKPIALNFPGWCSPGTRNEI